MPTYGQRPQDVVQDSRGNALRGVTVKFYASSEDASADVDSLGSAVTDSSGRWSYTADAGELWARMPDETVWEISGLALSGANDHGLLDGLADDDHAQYALADGTRGDFAATAHTHGVADLTATGTADATTYLRGDGTWATPAGGGGGVTDHGALTGLADDDHTQYALADGSRGSFAASSHTHTAANISDSTATGRSVLTAANASAARTAISAASTTHALTHQSGQSDALTLSQSQITNLTSDLAGKAATSHSHAAADITSGTVATARLGSGTASSSTFLRGDQTWATPAGGGGGSTLDTTSGASVLALGSTDAGTATQNTGIFVCGMIILPVDITFTSIACEVTTGAGSSTVTLAICTRSGNTLTKVFESSALDSTTSGVKSQTGVSQALTAGVYWVGSMSSGGAPQVRRMAPVGGSWAFGVPGSITSDILPFVYVSPEAPPLASTMTINEGTNALQPAFIRLGGVTY